MNREQIFLRLKNKKDITLFYRIDEYITYTINLSYREPLFCVNTYNFDGNDVFDEGSYKNEKNTAYLSFNECIDYLENRFPNIDFSQK